MIPTQKNLRPQAGFTLVELAIVMIIIGLLIAGVLKGQALIGNAKVTSQVAQIKAIDGAVSTFKDMYAGLPGDLLNATTRLPNCAAGTICAQTVAGATGDNALNLAPGVVQAATSENATFFAQLNAADLITGIDPTKAMTWGGQYPAAKINGGLGVGSTAGGVALTAGSEAAAATLGGLYLSVQLTTGAAAAAANAPITANDAQRVDTKVDDGVATSGNVSAFGTGGALGTAGVCWSTAAATLGQYNEAVQGNSCGLYVRIQG